MTTTPVPSTENLESDRNHPIQNPKPHPKSDPYPNPNPNPDQPNIAQNPTMSTPQQPTQPNDSLPPKSKKRQPDSNSFQIENSKYFKMRAVVKDLRPHFIELLRTTDFQNCKAAQEIREQTKLLKDLFKQIIAETVSTGQCNNVPEVQPVPGENRGVQKLEEQPIPDRIYAKPSGEKSFTSLNTFEKQLHDVQSHGTYIVGGSAFGWNFITYLGSKAVYYGETKESFRSRNNS